MKLEFGKLLEQVLREADKDETISEDGAMAAPATDSSAAGGTLPITMLGKVAKRKQLEDEEKKNEKVG